MYALSRMHSKTDAQVCCLCEKSGCVRADLNSLVCHGVALLNGLHAIPWQQCVSSSFPTFEWAVLKEHVSHDRRS